MKKLNLKYLNTMKMKKYTLLVPVLVLSLSLLAQPRKGDIKAVKPSVKCGVVTTNALIKAIDTSESRGVADNYYLWDNQSILTVKFQPGGSERMRNMVKQIVREWEQFSSLKFQFVDDNATKSNIRVQLGQGQGHNSYIGTYNNLISQTDRTMNLDTTDFVDWGYYVGEAKKNGTDFSKMTQEQISDFLASILAKPDLKINVSGMMGTVLHEFGHAIGLLHEQSYPGGIKWKKTDEVYEWYQKTQGWDKEKVDAQVFKVSDVFYTNGTSYDSKSIMQYAVEAWQTTDGFFIGSNNELSTGDKALVSALYPKDKSVSDREVPRVKVSNLTKLDIYTNSTRGGLVIYPSFEIETNSKLGQVYYVARLVTEDGYYLKDNDDKYNWGGYVATYVKAILTPNAKGSYNKTTTRNLELFLPFSEIPELNGKKVSVEFTVMLDDQVNGQYDKLMYYAATTPLSLPTK
jgi:serralysin